MDTPVTYVHFPRLVLPDTSVAVLGGTLQMPGFAKFESLDPDWARQSYYERTQPAFWVIEGIAEPAAALQEGMLIFNALLGVTGDLYPDPRLSMTYTVHGATTARRVGAYDRTWLLNGEGFQPIARDNLDRLAALAQEWHAYGFRYDHPVFSPLRGLASMASTFLDPGSGVLPLVASLEGFLIPARTQGIARKMAAVIRGLLREATPEPIDDIMRAVYRVRSSVVHGERVPSPDAGAVCGTLQILTGQIVVAAAREMARLKLDPQDLEGLRKTWIDL